MEIRELYKIFLDCGKISTDSRTIKGGELFFALKGENFDGNKYVEQALKAGAAFAIADNFPNSSDRVIVVKDVLQTLKDLARYHRYHGGKQGKEHLPVIALTGTNGKTTTKALITRVLAKKYKVTSTVGNLNNEIGLPLSLLQITPETEIAVIEMGASHPDDINRLTEICEPDYGLITNVGVAHLEGFGSFEGVKKTKGELYDYIDQKGKKVFVNLDDRTLLEMLANWPSLGFIPYGSHIDGIFVVDNPSNENLLPHLSFKVNDKIYETHLTGDYNLPNIMAAISVGKYFGVSIEDACEAIVGYVPDNSRSQVEVTEHNVLIEDAYNANPSSMKAALDNFATISGEKKVLFLGDMRELGTDSVKEHMMILRVAEAMDINQIFLVGEEFNKALINIGKRPRVTWFADSEGLADFIKANKIENCTALIKGSRGIQMEKIIPFL